MFVLTNSPFPFVDGGMRYLFQVLLHSLGKKQFQWYAIRNFLPLWVVTMSNSLSLIATSKKEMCTTTILNHIGVRSAPQLRNWFVINGVLLKLPQKFMTYWLIDPLPHWTHNFVTHPWPPTSEPLAAFLPATPPSLMIAFKNFSCAAEQETGNGQNWRDLFEVVIALSDKPNFYTSQRPFRFGSHHLSECSFSSFMSSSSQQDIGMTSPV